MDLLDTILRACQAEQYLSNFKENGIDSCVLKLLVEEDLQAIGIQDPETRTRILKHCANLQISAERKRDLTVDSQYASFVLSHMKVQLNKHLSNLTYALRRGDVDVCYIKVRPAALCLEGCMQSLDDQVLELERYISKGSDEKKKNKAYLLFGTMGCTLVVMLASACFFKYHTPLS